MADRFAEWPEGREGSACTKDGERGHCAGEIGRMEMVGGADGGDEMRTGEVGLFLCGTACAGAQGVYDEHMEFHVALETG